MRHTGVIISMAFLVLCGLTVCGYLEHEGGECEPGATRCGDSWNDWSICHEDRMWHGRDISPHVCIDNAPAYPCLVPCEVGEEHHHGDEVWACDEGDLCDVPYFQRSE